MAHGVSRSERACAFLLDRTRTGGATDAKAAVAALRTHAHEPGLAERVREAAGVNTSVDLRADIARAFRNRSGPGALTRVLASVHPQQSPADTTSARLKSMGNPAPRRATYRDLEKVPSHMVAEKPTRRPELSAATHVCR